MYQPNLWCLYSNSCDEKSKKHDVETAFFQLDPIRIRLHRAAAMVHHTSVFVGVFVCYPMHIPDCLLAHVLESQNRFLALQIRLRGFVFGIPDNRSVDGNCKNLYHRQS